LAAKYAIFVAPLYPAGFLTVFIIKKGGKFYIFLDFFAFVGYYNTL